MTLHTIDLPVRISTPAKWAGVILLLLAACSPTSGVPTVPPASPTATSVPPVIVNPTAAPATTQAAETTQPAATEPQPIVPAVTTTAASAFPASLPEAGSAAWVALPGEMELPIGIACPADGSGRLFVLEQHGRIRVYQQDQLEAQPYLDISGRVGSNGSERGLLGLAFHPRFAENGYFYINYTDLNGNTVISRFTADPAQNTADPASEHVLLRVDQPYPNHNGGGLAFGPDGFLYLGLGDGGSGGDPHGNGQSVDTLLGKLLRIDVDNADPYGIPADNPFAGGGGRPEIWAYGLRNPWRFSFDRQTSDLYIGDVGQNKWEEIDFLPAGSPGGANFGWNILEGTHEYSGSSSGGAQLTAPVAEYSHSDGCSVTGGVVYRGQALPAWQGVYLYGDYCSGMIWGLAQIGGAWQNQLLYSSGFSITSFGEDEAGEVYLTDHTGKLYRLEPAG